MKSWLLITLSFLLIACGDLDSSGQEFTRTPLPETNVPTAEPTLPSSLETPPVSTPNLPCPNRSPALLTAQHGEGTYHIVGNAGNCGLPPPDDLMVVAINAPQYAESGMCGACLKVTGPSGQVVVKVVDRCPECAEGDLDLSDAAFARIAAPIEGRIDITWEEVPCETQATVAYEVKPGSNPWWVGFQIRNHRHRIETLEALDSNNQYQSIPRLGYNYFVAPQGLGEGPFTLRITDVHGNSLEDSSIPLEEGLIINSHAQLPECPG